MRLLAIAAAVTCAVSAIPRGARAQSPALPACLSLEQQPSGAVPRPQGAPVMDAFNDLDAAPVLQNRDEVAAALQREYPPANRAAGIGGQTYLWVLVDNRGLARAGQVNISSGCAELDEAAMRAAEVMRFSPAVDEGRPIAVWVPIAINFDPAQGGGAPRSERTFTPFDVAPVIQNRDELAGALRREYSRELREALVTGRTIVWIQIDMEGSVQDVQINVSSGNAQLDEAALRVARVIRFSPALSQGAVVPVWVSIPIQFQP
jgi:TonB family protein